MTRLFRDWRFALLWVVGIAAVAASYVADRPGPAALAEAPTPTVPHPQVSAAPAPPQPHEQLEAEEEVAFGDPMAEPTGFDPNPADPDASQTASPPAPAHDPAQVPVVGEANPSAPAKP